MSKNILNTRTMSLTSWCCHLVVAAGIISFTNGQPQRTCANTPGNSTDVKFVPDPPGNLEFTCPMSAIDLACCMEGFSRVQWYEYLPEPQIWVPFIQNQDRYPIEDGQTLHFNRVFVKRDATNFSCVGYGHRGDEDVHITNNITLKIINCDVDRPSYFLTPQDVNTNELAQVGAHYHIVCQIKFDHATCETDGCNIWWYRRKPDDPMPDLIESASKYGDTDERMYYVEEKRDTINGFAKATLFIEGVEMEDFSWLYYCDATGEFPENNGARSLKLDEAVRPPTMGAFVASWSVFGIVILVLICIMLVAIRQKLKIQFYFKTKFNKLGRPQQANDNLHDIFILYNHESDEDRMFADTELCPELRETYRVHSTSDLSYGKSTFRSMSEALENSSVMLVVVSAALLEDEECKVAINDTVNTGKTKSTIYVIRERGLLNNIKDDYRFIAIAIRNGTQVKYGETFKWSCTGCQRNSGSDSDSEADDQKSGDYWKLKLKVKLIKMLERNNAENDTEQGCMRFHRAKGELNSQVSQDQVLIE